MQHLFENELDDELRGQVPVYGQSHDAQTGLMNFPAFQDRLISWMHFHPGVEVALVWIDVLNLRREFALWGRRGAEALIGRVADILRATVDSSGLVGRYSTRCFLVALKAEAPARLEKRRIQAILDALSPMRVPGAQGMVEVAAGVAFWPANTTSLDDLIRFASIAASRAAYVKSRSVLPFRTGMDRHLMRDRQIEIDMLRGMNRNQFRIVYQPKIELATGRILGVEALIRWDHLQWGAVMPSEFIPVAERSDLIHLILNFTLRTALEDARRWEEAGFDLPLIAVNLSWANMRREDFLSSIRAVLAEHPLARTGLELEITESVLFDDEDLFDRRVRQLKDLGLRVAIDDFGTRYTGFNMLKRTPLDTMKIDRCFIHGVDRTDEARALCQTIIAMGRQLRLRTVAEGVEEQAELDTLRALGCDAAQGFLIQRPMPAQEMAEFIRTWPARMQKLGFSGYGAKPVLPGQH